MPDLNELLKSNQAKKLMNNSKAIQDLKKAPETQRLMELINSQAGDSLEHIAHSASEGDTSQLLSTIQTILSNPESRSLLDKISKNFSL